MTTYYSGSTRNEFIAGCNGLTSSNFIDFIASMSNEPMASNRHSVWSSGAVGAFVREVLAEGALDPDCENEATDLFLGRLEATEPELYSVIDNGIAHTYSELQLSLDVIDLLIGRDI